RGGGRARGLGARAGRMGRSRGQARSPRVGAHPVDEGPLAMIGALLRVPGYRLMHAFGFPRMKPVNLTISTTFRCNSRCLTCNVYERPVVELNAEEWDKVFRSLGRSAMWFTFSGGEPFLRRDLVTIIESAWR